MGVANFIYFFVKNIIYISFWYTIGYNEYSYWWLVPGGLFISGFDEYRNQRHNKRNALQASSMIAPADLVGQIFPADLPSWVRNIHFSYSSYKVFFY